MTDEDLLRLNETELRELGRLQGLGRLRRGISPGIISGAESPEVEPPGTLFTRQKLEAFIMAHYDSIKHQLPGCDGHCTTFPCSEGRHAMCYLPIKDKVW